MADELKFDLIFIQFHILENQINIPNINWGHSLNSYGLLKTYKYGIQ